MVPTPARSLKETGINPVSPEARDWYSKDAKTQEAMKLLHVYHDAERAAPEHGWVGVGCVTYAERALVAAQLPDDPRANFVAAV